MSHQPWDEDWLFVTTPIQPELDELLPMLTEMLDRNWLSNQGPFARRLEDALAQALDVPQVALTTNGTLAIELAVKSVVPPGEVVTTGFSFPATWSLLVEDPRWNPVFADIDDAFCLDPAAVEAALTSRTTAILASHAYGTPCQHQRLAAIAARHDLALVYDAAPCFGVTLDGRGVGNLGDLSCFSFHATKVYNTLEGGCVTGAALDEVRLRRSFGMDASGTPVRHGTNAKMDEVRAIFGLLNIERAWQGIAVRGRVERYYLEHLEDIDQLELSVRRMDRPSVVRNHGYFPVLLDDRDGLLAHLKARHILPRPYFAETVPTVPLYRGLFEPGALPRTLDASRRVLCLPIHPRMDEAACARVVSAVRDFFGA